MRFLKIIVAMLVAGASAGAYAQARSAVYPVRPITLIIPYAAGGPTDTIARTIAAAMQKRLRQPIIVESVAGAGGTIGTQRVAHARPDGYTVLLHHMGMAAMPTLYPGLGIDPRTAFESVGEVTWVPMVLVGRRDLPPDSLAALLDYMHENGSHVSVAHAGVGSASWLCTLMFEHATHTRSGTTGYKGTAPAMADVLAGKRDLLCDQSTNAATHIRGDKLRVYGSTTAHRLTTLPGVPTLDEAGLKKFEIAVWHALYVPHGTPPRVVTVLNDALRFALSDSTVRARFRDLDTDSVPLEQATPEHAREHLDAEIARWRSIIEQARGQAE